MQIDTINGHVFEPFLTANATCKSSPQKIGSLFPQNPEIRMGMIARYTQKIGIHNLRYSHAIFAIRMPKSKAIANYQLIFYTSGRE